jgi:hypothetical protein
MKKTISSESNQKPLQTPKQNISYPSDRLTPSEIEQLKREKQEANEYCQKFYSENKPDWLK